MSADANIIAAFKRWQSAWIEQLARPNGPDDDHSDDLWDIVGAAEREAMSHRATTLNGAAIPLWMALANMNVSGDDLKRCLAADLDYFVEDRRLDWSERLVVAAIQSLAAIAARNAVEPEWTQAVAAWRELRQIEATHPSGTLDLDDPRRPEVEENGRAVYREGQRILHELIQMPVTSIEAVADKLAMLREDDPDEDAFAPLAAIEADLRRIGRRAMEIVQERLAGAQVPA